MPIQQTASSWKVREGYSTSPFASASPLWSSEQMPFMLAVFHRVHALSALNQSKRIHLRGKKPVPIFVNEASCYEHLKTRAEGSYSVLKISFPARPQKVWKLLAELKPAEEQGGLLTHAAMDDAAIDQFTIDYQALPVIPPTAKQQIHSMVGLGVLDVCVQFVKSRVTYSIFEINDKTRYFVATGEAWTQGNPWLDLQSALQSCYFGAKPEKKKKGHVLVYLHAPLPLQGIYKVNSDETYSFKKI